MLEIIYLFTCKCCVHNEFIMSKELTFQHKTLKVTGVAPNFCKKNLLIPTQLFFEAFQQIDNKLSFSDICGLAIITL
jgi:hypothetical protein